MRKIKRHPSCQGSVVTFDMFGVETNLFVADAKYRTTAAWMKGGAMYDKVSPGLDDFRSAAGNIKPTGFADDQTSALTYVLSDTQIQSRFPSLKADKTAKENTDILIQYDDSEAAHYCRKIIIPDVGKCDLPNLYELVIIYLESDKIDELDPTVKDYPKFALGMMNPHGRFSLGDLPPLRRFSSGEIIPYFANCWASTVYSSIYACTISYCGFCYHNHKYEINGVLPVKELNLK